MSIVLVATVKCTTVQGARFEVFVCFSGQSIGCELDGSDYVLRIPIIWIPTLKAVVGFDRPMKAPSMHIQKPY